MSVPASISLLDVFRQWCGDEELSEAARRAEGTDADALLDLVGAYQTYARNWRHPQDLLTSGGLRPYVPIVVPNRWRRGGFVYDEPDLQWSAAATAIGIEAALANPEALSHMLAGLMHLLVYAPGGLAIGNPLAGWFARESGTFALDVERRLLASYLRLLATLEPLLASGTLIVCENPWRPQRERNVETVDEIAAGFADTVFTDYAPRLTGSFDDELTRAALIDCVTEVAHGLVLAGLTNSYSPYIPPPPPFPLNLGPGPETNVILFTDRVLELAHEAASSVAADEGIDPALHPTKRPEPSLRAEYRRRAIITLADLPDIADLDLSDIVALQNESEALRSWRDELADALDHSVARIGSDDPETTSEIVREELAARLKDSQEKLRDRLKRQERRWWNNVIRPAGQEFLLAWAPGGVSATLLLGATVPQLAGGALLAGALGALIRGGRRALRELSKPDKATPGDFARYRHLCVMSPPRARDRFS